ncbi:MAG: hypothetical protein KAU99_01205 [Thermoplasmata archaeon]|nr:hypothetical protein [Thermoplasmata archaeon]
MILDEVYYDELTDSTLQELKNIGRWFNTLYGNYPIVIGGWAVWLYNPLGYGSRDIDLLFPERRMKERLANQYLSANGYILKKQSPFEEQFVKVVETSRGNEEIYLDACSVEGHEQSAWNKRGDAMGAGNQKQRTDGPQGAEVLRPQA